LPEIFVINAKGQIAFEHVGLFNRRMLDADNISVVQGPHVEETS